MTTDLLLDVNIVVDLCAEREPHVVSALSALDKAQKAQVPCWLYAGSVQTLEYVLANELRRLAAESGRHLSLRDSHEKARSLLEAFSADKQWLAALAEDGLVWGASDPEDAQYCRAVTRMGSRARLLTRDETLLAECPQAVSPAAFLAGEGPVAGIPFADLAAQQRRVRPALERNAHVVFHHGQYIMGPEVRELEKKLAAYVGAKHAVGCASGTDALLLPLMALGVGPGDAVFSTPFTFIATAEVISLLGATPVFVDIDPATYNIDPGHLERALQALAAGDGNLHPLPANHRDLKARGVIPVDLFGLPADYDALRAVCAAHVLFLLEDAAQSFGAESKGRKAGSFGDAAATSFFPAKPLGCYGDGGMVFTDRDDLAEICRSLLVHGKGTDKYDNVRIGMNARLDTLQAALVLAKFEVFPEEVEARQRLARRYTERFEAAPGRPVGVPRVPEGLISAWAQYTLRVAAARRAGLQAALGRAGIPTAVYYPKPLHLQTAFRDLGYRPGDFPVSEAASAEVLSLPFGPYLSDGECDRAASTVLTCSA